MPGEELIVWLIAAAAFGCALRALFRRLTGRRRGGCSACAQNGCPLRDLPRNTRPTSCPKPSRHPSEKKVPKEGSQVLKKN